jgi:2-polyprenyl-3-methyl-5-hydroxy-6-metoxy-1,4-benzoquinol methylase
MPTAEETRILRTYEKRSKLITLTFFRYRSSADFLMLQECHFETLRLLKWHGFCSFDNMRILDVGCGDGKLLRFFLSGGGDQSYWLALNFGQNQWPLPVT